MNLYKQRKSWLAFRALYLCLVFLSVPGMAEIVLPDGQAQSVDTASSAQQGRSGYPLGPDVPAYPEPGRQAADSLAESLSSMLPSHHDELMRSQHMGGMLSGMLIPLLVLSLIFGGPVILVIVLAILHYRARARRERMQSENIARLIEAGREVPTELLRGDEPISASAEDNLRKGVKNIGIGTGLLIFLTLLLGIGIGSVGFILIGLGISQLVVWKLTDTKAAQAISRD